MVKAILLVSLSCLPADRVHQVVQTVDQLMSFLDDLSIGLVHGWWRASVGIYTTHPAPPAFRNRKEAKDLLLSWFFVGVAPPRATPWLGGWGRARAPAPRARRSRGHPQLTIFWQGGQAGPLYTEEASRSLSGNYITSRTDT